MVDMLDLEKLKVEKRQLKIEKRRSYIRSTSIPFISIVGALLMGLFVHEVYNLSKWYHFFYFLASMFLFIRYFWFYLNTITYFSPFASLYFLTIDLLGLFFGALTIYNIHNLNLWFWTGSSCLAIITHRISLAIKFAADVQEDEGWFDEKDLKIMKGLLPSFQKMTKYFAALILILGVIVKTGETVEALIGIILLFISALIYSSYIPAHFPYSLFADEKEYAPQFLLLSKWKQIVARFEKNFI